MREEDPWVDVDALVLCELCEERVDVGGCSAAR